MINMYAQRITRFIFMWNLGPVWEIPSWECTERKVGSPLLIMFHHIFASKPIGQPYVYIL